MHNKFKFNFFLLIFSTLFLLSTTQQKDVYICKGKSSKRYHLDKYCRGLSNCSTDIYKVSLKEAKRIGRTLCGWGD